jgi:hypothetical protein
MMGSDYWHPHWGNHSSRQWALKFAWLPARMDNGEFVWLRKYYHGVRIVTGPGTDVILYQRMTMEEFTWHALKQHK